MRKVLIATRGEMAVRLVRACRDAGLGSVAVYADPERDALHVRVADEAVALGGTTPADGYLDEARVLRAAAGSGADAVHPGYGPLAERPAFAQAVRDAGLTWIGPPPAVLRTLAGKASARRRAMAAGVPAVTGTTVPLTGVGEALAFAREHGCPVVFKAAFGGGGRGLRVAWSQEEVPVSYEAVVRASMAASGRAECVAERYLDRPRHLEAQCLADAHGTVMVVSTRDCSLQRRYQKVIEEAPAPYLPAGHDARLRAASRAILRATGCVGAATCEFLLDSGGGLSFLEVNPRLSMAHPVTEEVTGVDLVRETFRMARGERLDDGDPPVRGHAVQFRVYGEVPGDGFRPAGGVVCAWRPPTGPGLRLDTGVERGDVIRPVFGTLLAKLVVTGPTREAALRRARRALRDFEVGGLPTNLPFLRRVAADPVFASADPGGSFGVHTRWIDEARH